MTITRQTLRLIPPRRPHRLSVMCHDPGDAAGGLAVVEVEPLSGRPMVRWVLSYGATDARLWQRGVGLQSTSAGSLFGLLALAPVYRGDYVGELLRPFKGFNKGFRTLVEASGAVKHWARARGCVVSTAEPSPNDWRARVLGLRTGTAADACAATAVAAVEGRPAPGSRYHVDLGLVEAVAPIDEHGAEAICIGLDWLGYRLEVVGG
jgi:hypothetical protein